MFLPFAAAVTTRRALFSFAVPAAFVGLNAASTYPAQWNDAFYYGFLAVPGLLASAALQVPALEKSCARLGRRAAVAAALLFFTAAVSGSAAFLRRGEIVVPAVAHKIWRVAPAEAMRDLHGCAELLPAREPVLVTGALGNYLPGPTVRAEVTARDGVAPPFALVRPDGENLEPRFGVGEDLMTAFVRKNYRVRRRCGGFVVLERRENAEKSSETVLNAPADGL
ncbi:MAG: hypothetical protein M5R36_26445 [Deltaproteobacteria bacterium]|nr:hypothetical protein [Deltaproteobacteria bacterium]